MSRRRDRRNHSNHDDDLNLTPFMNMVVILIPLLLLSVVFLKVGVINVSSPAIAPETSSEEPPKDLGLTVGISKKGFTISTREKTLPPVDGCPDDGPTVCLARPEVAVDAKIERARKATQTGRDTEVQALLDEVVAAYDFAALYSELRAIKADHPGESSLRLTASPQIPYELLVRVMDAVRFELDQKRYASNEAFWQASATSHNGELFSRPILAIGN